MSDEGYAVIPKWLLRDGSVTTSAKVVWLLLSARVRGNGHPCWPSQALLAEEAGVDIRTIRRAVSELKSKGLVEVETVRTSTGRLNHYRLVHDPFGGGRPGHTGPGG